jgi:hypothetical protein
MERERYPDNKAERAESTDKNKETMLRRGLAKYGKRALAGVLIAAALTTFSGCEKGGEDVDAAASPPNTIEATEPSAEPIEETPEAIFEQGESETFTVERNGYSVQVQVNTWEGIQGTGEALPHPGDESIMLPTVSKSDCIIPFEVNVLVATEGGFETDVALMIDRFFLLQSNDSFDKHKYLTTATLSSQIGDSKGIANIYPWDDLPSNSRKKVEAYLLISDYYSPSHPNGDSEYMIDNAMGIDIYAKVGFHDADIDGSTMRFNAEPTGNGLRLSMPNSE